MANPYFNATYYLANNPDIFAAGVTTATAWDHYVSYGAQEAYTAGGMTRAPNAWFDAKFYLQNNQDLIANGVTPETAFDHFTSFGMYELRAPSQSVAASPMTDASLLAYVNANADVAEALGVTVPATELTEAQQNGAIANFYGYGYAENRPSAPTNANANPTETFTLTTGADTATANYFDGSAPLGADVRQQTLNNSDSLTGAGDNATLYAALTGGAVAPQSLKNIANVDIELGFATAAAATLNAVNADSISQLSVSNNTNGFTLSNLSTALSSVALTNSTGAVTLQHLTGVTSEEPLEITLNQVTGGALNVGNAYAAANVTSTGAVDNVLASLAAGTGTALKELTVAGDQNLNLGTALPNALTTVNAEAFTGNLSLVTGTGNMTITGGAGNDNVDFGATLTNADAYDGGEGRDTVQVSAASGLAAGNGLSNVEILRVNGGASFNFNNDLVASIDAIVHNSTAAMTYSNLVGANAADSAKGVTLLNGGAVTVSIKGADAAGSLTDALHLNIGATGAAGSALNPAAGPGATTGTITANSIETITFDVKANNGGFTSNGTGTITADAVTTLTILGGAANQNFALGNVSNAGLVKIDASSFSGNLITAATTLANGNVNQVLIGGSGNDTLNAGGADAATITSGGGKDILTGGAGNDIFQFTTSAGAGNDMYTATTFAAAPAAAGGGAAGDLAAVRAVIDVITDADFGGAALAARVDTIQVDATTAVAGGPIVLNGGAVTALTGTSAGVALDALFAAGGQLAGTAGAIGLFSFGGATFLAGAATAAAGYTAGEDFIIEVTGYTGTLDASDFTWA